MMSENPVLHGHELEDEFCEIARSFGGDVTGRASGASYLMSTHATYHGGPLTWSMVPKIFDRAALEILRDAAETMGSIMEKVTRRAIDDPQFRALFRMGDTLDRMVQIPCGYDQIFPLARVDIFLNEDTGDYWLCEVNTDGSSGMTLSDETTRAITQSMTYQKFAEKHPNIVLRDNLVAWAHELLETYRTWQVDNPETYKPDVPDVVVVDYAESIDTEELADYIEHWRDMGVPARFADIRDLKIEKVDGRERLVDTQGVVPCVWRRAVTGEIARKPCAGADALCEAAEKNLACIIGGFRTWPAATKAFFAVLHEPGACDFLNEYEQEYIAKHVPVTHFLDTSSDLSQYADRAHWIAKPEGGYNSEGVVAGADCTDEQWQETLASVARVGGIVQAYVPQYATPVIPVTDGQPGISGAPGDDPLDFPMANNMEGLFLFNGKFMGVFSRCGIGKVIGEHQGRFNQGCLFVFE